MPTVLMSELADLQKTGRTVSTVGVPDPRDLLDI
jgi:hypothetical protein